LGRGDHLTRIDPDPDGETDAVSPLDVAGKIREPGHDLRRGTDRPGGVVLADAGHPEERHCGVTDVLLDAAAPRGDGRRHEREVVLEDRADMLRVESVAERRGL